MKIKIKDIEVKEDSNLRVDLGEIEVLAQSLKDKGQITPILVRPSKNPEYKYELVVGFRRIASSNILEWTEIEAEVKELTDDEVDWIRYDENDKAKRNTWWEEARFFMKKNKEGNSTQDIAKKIGKSQSYVADRTGALRLFEVTAQAVKLQQRNALEITYANRNDWEYLSNRALTEKWSKDDIRKRVQGAKKIIVTLDTIEDRELKNILKEFYYPLRYEKGSYEAMEKELALRTGRANPSDKFVPVERITEEEAREEAVRLHGEFLGKTTIEAWHLYVIPYTIEEIRERLKDKD